MSPTAPWRIGLHLPDIILQSTWPHPFLQSTFDVPGPRMPGVVSCYGKTVNAPVVAPTTSR